MVDKEKPEKSEDEWSNLRSEVDDAITNHDASSIDFSSKNIYQCKFQQKYAEVEKSEYPTLFSVIIFGLALGLGLTSRFNLNDVGSIFQAGVGFMLILFTWFIVYKKLYRPRHKTCVEIIVNAEKQIQELSKGEHIKDKG